MGANTVTPDWNEIRLWRKPMRQEAWFRTVGFWVTGASRKPPVRDGWIRFEDGLSGGGQPPPVKGSVATLRRRRDRVNAVG